MHSLDPLASRGAGNQASRRDPGDARPPPEEDSALRPTMPGRSDASTSLQSMMPSIGNQYMHHSGTRGSIQQHQRLQKNTYLSWHNTLSWPVVCRAHPKQGCRHVLRCIACRKTAKARRLRCLPPGTRFCTVTCICIDDTGNPACSLCLIFM